MRILFAVLLAAAVSAQGGGKPTTGNPTPGTKQPDPPVLADRVTLIGCVRVAPKSSRVNENTVTESRFELTSAERRSNVPADTGGSSFAAETTARTYRLSAIESQLSPFVGAKVEISGELLHRSSDSPRNTVPALLVEFVQKVAARCN